MCNIVSESQEYEHTRGYVGENKFGFHNSTIFTGCGEIINYCFHDQQRFSHVIKHLDTNSMIPRDRTNPFDLNELH